MLILKHCSELHINPWTHYTVKNYFEKTVLSSLLSQINTFDFKPSTDVFRNEFNFKYELNNQIISSILDSFLRKENINFLSSIDQRFALAKKMLRISIWKDFNGLHLPMHTDSDYKLFTMQIYLPRNTETEYGTTFYDQEGNFFKKTNYTLNDGYFFFPNINKIKTNHSFVEDIKTERCSIIFNIIDKQLYMKRNSIALEKRLIIAKNLSNFIEF